MRDITLADTIYVMFTTRRFTTGAPFTLAGSPVVSAYENDSATQITAGITLGVDHDTVTGMNLLTIAATGANGYEAGKDYNLVITTGTVDSVSVVGEVVGQFQIARSAAAVDLANGTDGLTALATDIAAVKAETALIVADTGTDGVVIAANAVSAAALAADAGTEIGTAVWATATRVLTANTNLNDPTAATIAGLVWDEDATGHQTGGTFGQAIGDPAANTETIYDAVVTDATGINVATDVVAVQADLDNGTDGLGAIKTETAAILVDVANIDGIVPAAAGDSMALTAAAVDSIWDEDIVAAHNTADTAGAILNNILPEKNAAFPNIEFLWVAASDHVTPVTGATTTSVTRSIDGSAFGSGTGTLAEVGNGIYQYDASAADMNGTIITFRFVATGGTPGAPDDCFVTIKTSG